MDIVENLERFLAGSNPTSAVRTRMTKARDEIVRVRKTAAECYAALQFVLKHGAPMCRDGQYRYHGVENPVWFMTPIEAIEVAMADPNFQPESGAKG